ncbi:MAG: hypothetical protein PGN25_00935 [Methylorubrum populi]
MTIDKQLDRHAELLAFVSEQNYPKNPDRTPDQSVTDEDEVVNKDPKPIPSSTNAFEGFGSFSGSEPV